MTGHGFRQLPPSIDYADPETDSLCHYCENVLLDGGDCAVCEPRCLLEDSPVRFSATLLDDGLVRFEAVELYTFPAGDTGLALVTWEGGPLTERRCVGVRGLWGAEVRS